MALRDSACLLLGLLLLCHTWGAWAIVEVNMEDRVEVMRGENTQITCMFTSDDGIGGMIITWYYVTRSGEKQEIYQQDSTMRVVKKGTQFTERISVNGTLANGQVVLTISDVDISDEVEFICLIRSLTYGTAEGRTKLRVFEMPDLPTIDVVQKGISVSEDTPKIGVCEVKNGYPKPNITWYRNTTPLRSSDRVKPQPSITTESTGLFSIKNELSMTLTKEDKDATFYCEVTYFVPGGMRMTETNAVNLTVLYPSTSVSLWVESPKGMIKEGDTVELRCQGDGNSAVSFTILHDPTGLQVDTNSLVLHNVTEKNSGDYRCVSLDMETFEEISGNTTLFVNFLKQAVVYPKNDVEMELDDFLTAICRAPSSLPTQTVWLKDGEQISTGHILSLTNVTFDSAGTYICVVTVLEIEGMETTGELVVLVLGAPEVIVPENVELEATYDTMVDLTCLVKGYPLPTITWVTSDGEVLKETVTSNITAYCIASNSYGNDSQSFSIKGTSHTTQIPTISSTSSTSISSSTASHTTQSPTTSSTRTSISSSTVKAKTAIPPKKIKKEGSGVIIAVIIICILLLAILGSVLYFMYKKGKICGRSGKQDLTKEKSSKDNIVVEMKSDNTEEAILLGVNGDKPPPNEQ
ncbi:melanoma cell adhesion molecule b [Cynoglossus semilaevis]|uniref:melanoma cell adhesion molecule b n=1 Tax=Cynoglossus semilaevis TaxID=244447 RepID=UPI00049507F3|nr:cell surface glycoprotein MUC18 [Cynoglossus semilaevis]